MAIKSNSKIHFERLQKALKNKKLIVVQFSTTSLNKERPKLTSFFSIKYFTDEEWYVLGNDPEFKQKLADYFTENKDYYFLIWNHNSTYSHKIFDLAFSQWDLKNLENKIIDFDDAVEIYAENVGKKYLEKPAGGFDTRYYLALLNKISVPSFWINGRYEANLKDQELLRFSSRSKAKIMCALLDKLNKGTLEVGYNEKFIEKEKEIRDLKARFSLELKQHEKIKILLIGIVIWLVLRIIEFLFNAFLSHIFTGLSNR